jgi:hypothetical protein
VAVGTLVLAGVMLGGGRLLAFTGWTTGVVGSVGSVERESAGTSAVWGWTDGKAKRDAGVRAMVPERVGS